MIRASAFVLMVLMYLTVPVGIILWLWSGDWRWFAAGLVLGIVGWFMGWTFTESMKQVKR